MRQWWKLMWPLGISIGTLVAAAPLNSAVSRRIASSSPRSRCAKWRVESSPSISFHRWLPSIMVMVPISTPQSWNGMKAVSIRSEVQVCQ